MEETERLQYENKELKAECEFLRKVITDERRFFIQEFKYSIIENYRQTVQINREHEKELQNAAQKY